MLEGNGNQQIFLTACHILQWYKTLHAVHSFRQLCLGSWLRGLPLPQ